MRQVNKARIMLALSMVIFGTLAPFVRNIPVSSGELALYRAVMAAIVILAYLFLRRKPVDFAAIRKDLIGLLFSGVAMGFNWILLFEAYKYTTVSVATLSYYFQPVIVTLVSPFLFKEKLTKKQILCFVMSTIGLVLVTGVAGQGTNDLKGIAFGIGAAVLYATVVLINKALKNVAGIERTFLQFLAAILVLIPYVAFTSGVNLTEVKGVGIACLLVVGLVHTGLTYCMYFSSLKDIPGQEAAILGYMDPLVAIIISVTVLGEPLGIWQLIGGILILGFTLLNEIKLKKE